MGDVASLFGVLAGDKFKVKNDSGYTLPGEYWFSDTGIVSDNESFLDSAYVLTKLLNGTYTMECIDKEVQL